MGFDLILGVLDMLANGNGYEFCVNQTLGMGCMGIRYCQTITIPVRQTQV
jgi:hypothetical protein